MKTMRTFDRCKYESSADSPYMQLCLHLAASACLSFCQEVSEDAPISKAPRRSVTQWAVKMLIQHTHTHARSGYPACRQPSAGRE